MLQDTLVMIGGEFGRTPAVEVSGKVKVQNGRDHNTMASAICSPAAALKVARRTAPPTSSGLKQWRTGSTCMTYMQPFFT